MWTGSHCSPCLVLLIFAQISVCFPWNIVDVLAEQKSHLLWCFSGKSLSLRKDLTFPQPPSLHAEKRNTEKNLAVSFLWIIVVNGGARAVSKSACKTMAALYIYYRIIFTQSAAQMHAISDPLWIIADFAPSLPPTPLHCPPQMLDLLNSVI